MSKPQDFLSDIELDKVRQFQADEVMKEAVKKVILAPIYETGVLKKGKKADPLTNFLLVFASQNLDLEDSKLGAQLRGRFEGINFVEVGFGQIDACKREPELTKKLINPR